MRNPMMLNPILQNPILLNPILSFSATRRMRSFRTLVVAGAYAGVLLAIAIVMLGSFFQPRVSIGNMAAGMNCYAVMMAAQFALLVLIAPAMTSGAIAGERERQTLELLLVTQTGSFRIVLGKALESFALLALLIACGLPPVCLCLMAGGITFAQVLLGEAFLLAVAFGAACVGIFCSALSRGTMMSTVLSYLALLVIGAVTALPFLLGYPQRITDVVYDAAAYADLTAAGALGMISPLLLLNPAYGFAALIQGQTLLLGARMEYSPHGRLLCTWLVMDRAGCETIALLSGCAIAAVGFLMLVPAALLVRPRDRRIKQKG